MQTAGGVDYNHLGALCFGRAYSVESHGGGVAAHLLLHDRHAHALAPDVKLLYRGCAERIGCAKHHLVACLLVLVSQLADGRGLAYAVDADNHYDVWLALGVGYFEVLEQAGVLRLLQHAGYLVGQESAEFFAAHVLVLGHTFLQTVYYLQSCVGADVAGHERLLKIVQDLVVHRALAGDGM